MYDYVFLISLKEMVFLMGEIFVIASGKGGVGKSTISAHLGIALSKMGSKTLLVDADLHLRNLDIILGMQNDIVYDINDMYLNNCDKSKCIYNHPKYPSLFFIAGPSAIDIDTEQLPVFISEFCVKNKNEYDYIIIDCPSGVDTVFQNLCSPNIKLLLVATPDMCSVRDAEKASILASEWGVGYIRLIINKVRPLLVKKRLSPNIDNIIDDTSVQLLGLIPDDINVIMLSNTSGYLMEEKKSTAKIAVENIAKRMAGATVGLYKFW